jgi:hypothetical protein
MKFRINRFMWLEIIYAKINDLAYEKIINSEEDYLLWMIR